ncbi:hypothetical protein [Geobacter argillaceus]|uniref:Uncharacterized protein n=1 Tax=Geobacter argillaceus TaxID=345631 RepID=A0A562WQN7_9BACT|nr:hypothetical protein [Geobacter argillaceus]TWJ32639.1 hypothetical protein JN12_00613 [Geobacter argillaceus]
MFGFRLKSDRIAWFLLALSLILYGLDYWLYGRAGEIGFGFLGNLAFLPIYVLLVTLMIERVLKEREKEALRQKLNMVIGLFFSEVGKALLKNGHGFVTDGRELAERVKISTLWNGDDFRSLAAWLKRMDVKMDSRLGDLPALKEFLRGKRTFLLSLMENPNLLEHDDFTDLLWAVFHLLEELESRTELAGLPGSDLDHLTGDIKRAHIHLLRQWVAYLEHLKEDYPYLFSLAVRTNPLNPGAQIEVD